MKKISKIIAIFAIVAIMVSTFAISAFAAKDTVEDFRKSVVYIETEFKYPATNSDLVITGAVASGTAFAVGEPGKPVQYVATCNHCVYEKEGVYICEFDLSGNILDIALLEDGTSYPAKFKEGNRIYVVDYFKPETVSIRAYYSKTSGDYVELNVIGYDDEVDVAVCKLASEPTEKIEARPFKKRDVISTGDTVYAIGYPSTSKYFDGEGKMDSSDSTVTKGIISNTVMTYGMRGAKKQFYVHQIDADITNGNSGGPLFTEDGCIIGVNAFGNINAAAAHKAQYAITSDELIKILDAHSIPYKIAGTVNVGLIIGIVAGVIVLAAVAVVIILLTSKKNKKSPVDNANTAADNRMDNVVSPLTGKYYLIGVKGVFEGKKYSIDNKAVIGRNSERCNVVFPENHPGISAVHCEIVRSGSGLVIKDCGSSYGTFIGSGEKLTPNNPVVLRSGDMFWVGDKENVFEVKY
ncbi:MAG: FHA domain-containing protein [Ruminococcaceae bacterium]|nr:FHA domain-containing protein [Oscillospiraceae bacterium]